MWSTHVFLSILGRIVSSLLAFSYRRSRIGCGVEVLVAASISIVPTEMELFGKLKKGSGWVTYNPEVQLTVCSSTIIHFEPTFEWITGLNTTLPKVCVLKLWWIIQVIRVPTLTNRTPANLTISALWSLDVSGESEFLNADNLKLTRYLNSNSLR